MAGCRPSFFLRVFCGPRLCLGPLKHTKHNELPYGIYSNKRRGAYLIFRVSSAALIRGRRLSEGSAYLISLLQKLQGRERGRLVPVVPAKFTAFTQELKNAKILKRELNERASRYTHYELNNITIDESKFPLQA